MTEDLNSGCGFTEAVAPNVEPEASSALTEVQGDAASVQPAVEEAEEAGLVVRVNILEEVTSDGVVEIEDRGDSEFDEYEDEEEDDGGVGQEQNRYNGEGTVIESFSDDYR